MFNPNSFTIPKSGQQTKPKPQKKGPTPYDVAFYDRQKKKDEMAKKASAGRERFLARLCVDYNNGTCNDEAKCGKLHKCSKPVKQLVNGQERDRICGQPHPAKDHQ